MACFGRYSCGSANHQKAVDAECFDLAGISSAAIYPFLSGAAMKIVYRIIDKVDGSWQDFTAEEYALCVWDSDSRDGPVLEFKLQEIPEVTLGWDANGTPV